MMVCIAKCEFAPVHGSRRYVTDSTRTHTANDRQPGNRRPVKTSAADIATPRSAKLLLVRTWPTRNSRTEADRNAAFKLLWTSNVYETTFGHGTPIRRPISRSSAITMAAPAAQPVKTSGITLPTMSRTDNHRYRDTIFGRPRTARANHR